MAKCTAVLIELRNAIKQELSEEGAAAHKYADMAAKFTHLSETQYADMLRLLSGQENLHRLVLDFIVNEVTAKCGE